MTGTRALAFVMVAPLFAGCWFFDGWGGDDGWGGRTGEIPAPYNDGSLVVAASSQSGDMGDIRGFEGDAVASQASYYGDGASIRLDSLGDRWWVMSYLSVSGLDIVNAAPGTYGSTDGVYLSVTGCSGESYGNYTYDGPSSTTTVTITDNGDGTRNLTFRATYDDWAGPTQTTVGSFDYSAGRAYEEPTGYVQQSILASDGAQEGSMGDIVAYDGPATASESYYYGNSSSIRLDSEGSGWWVMSYLTVSNLDLATAPAGEYRSSISATYDGTAPSVSVIGCSGPDYGNYTYDGGADEVVMQLSDNEDGSRTIDLTATYGFTGSPQTARTVFRFRVL